MEGLKEKVYNQVFDLVNNFMDENAEIVDNLCLDLHPKVHFPIWVCRDFLAVEVENREMLESLADFGLIHSSFVSELGPFVLYSSYDSLVNMHIEAWYSQK